MGKYRLTEQHDSEEAAILDGTTMTWNRVLQIMQALIEINAEETLFKNESERMKRELNPTLEELTQK